MAVRQVLKSRGHISSSLSQQESFDGLEGSVDREAEAEKAACERSGIVNHAMLLLALDRFKHLHDLLGNSASYVLKDDKLSEKSAVQQFRFMPSALLLVSATAGDENAHLLHFKRSAVSAAEVVERDDKENAVRRKASTGVELCLEKGRSLVYGGEEPPAPNVRAVVSKKRYRPRRCYQLKTGRASPRRAEEAEERTGYGGLEIKRWIKER